MNHHKTELEILYAPEQLPEARRDHLRPLQHDFDDLDEADANPILDKPGQRRTEREVDRVMRLLDEIQAERLRKQNFEQKGLKP